MSRGDSFVWEWMSKWPSPHKALLPTDPRIKGIPKVGEDGLSKRDVLLLSRAAHHYVKTGGCARVEWADESVNRAGQYYLNCGPVGNVFFNKSDIPWADSLLAFILRDGASKAGRRQAFVQPTSLGAPSWSPPTPHLSKSRYLAAQQCDRRLWLSIHDRTSATPLSEATQHIFNTGSEVGRAAHALFPSGVLVEAPASNHAAALEQTRALMADPTIPAIFEAAFEHNDVRIRVDILERHDSGRWGLREVKSAGKLKPEQHLPDLAIQKWVLEGSGLTIDSAELIHVNNQYVRGEGPIDWPGFFTRVEVLKDLARLESSESIADRVLSMHKILAEPVVPLREPGAFCKRPHLCGYWEACTQEKSAEWRLEQTGLSKGKKAKAIEVMESGKPWISDKLAGALEAAAPPVWALDFEAMNPAIPFYPGTRPFATLAFQWSAHRLAGYGDGGRNGGRDREGDIPIPNPGAAEPRLDHSEFLAEGDVDPRSEVAQSLVVTLGQDDAPILVYSPYEKRCLKDMAKHVPDLAPELDAIARRLVDLLPIVRKHVYHPDLLGSFSIKKVGPAFAPHVTYSDLEGVADGTAAMSAFERIVGGELGAAEQRSLRAELREYCKRDTLALMEVFRALRRASAS